ncbi:MAG: hypothetical protein IKS14_04640, partial [Thermoguttaceae bacterium]|nr:hypothetical protein [Thermoguttaceae bacterium]
APADRAFLVVLNGHMLLKIGVNFRRDFRHAVFLNEREDRRLDGRKPRMQFQIDALFLFAGFRGRRLVDFVRFAQERERRAVGRRYRRQDEIGTPFCVTVDGQTLQDGTVTLRDRDTLEQVRVKKDELLTQLQQRIG